MLNNSCEKAHACLPPYSRGKAFSFSPLSKILAESLLYIAFIMLRYYSTHFILINLSISDKMGKNGAILCLTSMSHSNVG